jgi:hypothetical protein
MIRYFYFSGCVKLLFQINYKKGAYFISILKILLTFRSKFDNIIINKPGLTTTPMKRTLTLLFLLICSTTFSQESIKWGKPTDSDKSMKICSFDTAANAVILSEIGSIDFVAGYAYIRIYRKIKILNQAGIKHANVEIPYYNYELLERVQDLKAQTINYENGKMVKTDLDRNEIYTKIINSRWNEIRFTFPSAKEGSILEYRYTLVTKRITFLNAWEFQHEIPAASSEISVVFPPDLVYSVLLYGTKLRAKYHGIEVSDGVWSLKEISGYENEENVSCYEDYVEKLQFQLRSYEAWEKGGYSNGIHTVEVMKTWDDLAHDVSEEFQLYLNRKGAAREILDAVVNTSDDNETKTRKIYAYVNSNFKWDNTYSFFPEKSFSELLDSREGSSAELNLLLCLLLDEAGIPANPVLISTKSHGKVTRDYPLLEQFTHVIVATGSDPAYRFIDVISNSGDCYLIPPAHTNYYGFMLDGAKGKWIDVVPRSDSKTSRNIVCMFDSNGVYLQEMTRYTGYFGTDERHSENNRDPKQQEFLSFVTDLSFKLDSSSISGLEDEYSDFLRTEYFSSPLKNNDKYFFNLNIDNLENKFNQNKRLFPVEFDYPYIKQTKYSIIIPKGYTVKVLPKTLSIALPDDAGRFSYITSYSGNQVVVTIKQELKKTILPKDYYYLLKEFYNQIIMKLNEPILIERES